LNDLETENKNLRKEIDVCRKEQGVQDKVISSYTKEIKQLTEKAKGMLKNTANTTKGAQDTSNQILALKAKHDIDKFNFEHKINELQEKLLDKEDDQAEKTRSKDMGNTKKAQVTEFANPAFLMKLRKDKVLAYNKEKKKLLDNYTRNVKIIEDAFDQIKDSTGIASVDEIVTTFIKTEEQNISLFNYLNLLNNEVDMIEEQNKNIEDEIRRHEMLAEMGEADKKIALDKIVKEMEEINNHYKQK
jgi:coiled-coil domain-containing protein 63/114